MKYGTRRFVRMFGLGLVLLSASIGAVQVRAQKDYKQLQEGWQRRQYADVLDGLINFRLSTGKRDLYVDYMIATSACRIEKQKEKGAEYFAWILYSYDLSGENKQIIEAERQQCVVGTAPTLLRASMPATLVGVRYMGKGGPEFGGKPSGNGTSTVAEAIEPEVFAKRLFPPDESASAESAIKKVLGNDIQVEHVAHFELVTVTQVRIRAGGIDLNEIPNAAAQYPLNAANAPDSPPTTKLPVIQTPNAPSETGAVPPQSKSNTGPQQFSSSKERTAPDCAPSPVQASRPECEKPDSKIEVGRALEKYLEFYEKKFGMKSPENLISVYFTNSYGEINEVARKLHGINLAYGSVGYSFTPDQSMVAWASSQAYGTFAHELFHLMVHQNFGDIPAWMDEGIAALYEVSETRGDQVLGVDNWRAGILQAGWDSRPKLAELIRMDRNMFNQPRGNSNQLLAGQDQAVTHATARYFMLYLQEKGLLVPLYKAFRGRGVTVNPAEDAVKLTEQTLGDSLEHVDGQFQDWFLKNHPQR